MLFVIASIVLVLLLGYLFCLKGRTGYADFSQFQKFSYAHRGLHDATRPENSMTAFQAALDAGYGIELDIHLMKDGNLAVIHDASLKRTANADVKIEDLTTKDLDKYRLCGTEQTIPQFQQVLDLFAGKAPLIVELKCEGGNHAALCQAACRMLDGYDGLYCMESFDPRAVHWLKKHRPDVIRGQLSENWMKKKLGIPAILKMCLTYHIANVYTRPDFIAYKFADRKAFGTGLCRNLFGIQGVSWTLRSREEYDAAVAEGWIPIFENFTV